MSSGLGTTRSAPFASASRPSLRLRMRRALFGDPLRTTAIEGERLGVAGAIAVFSADALSSVAYATEEILLALAAAGAFHLSWPIALAIVALLVIVVASYSQTVEAYPQGGGAYIVAKDQLGRWPSLVAAASLIIDYILTVAVSITAGARALASAFPSLAGHATTLAVVAVIVLAWINLRGMRESARVLALPVYAFIAAILALGATGVVASLTGAPVAVEQPPVGPGEAAGLVGILLILRAFAGGCTAMTGIEAVANAGSILADPPHVKARWTLITMGTLLALMFLSITWSADHFAIVPQDSESVLSQVTRSLWGEGPAHWAVQLLTAFILLLAANTAFAGMPKLACILASDGWLPRQLSALGDRLVFNNGIYVLAAAAILLIIAFQGDTHRLIPLYAVGVFTAFTLSQCGMVRYWLKHRHDPNHRHALAKAALNATGALATGVTLLVTAEAKFVEGAFLVLIAVPMVVALCWAIHRHYMQAEDDLAVDLVTVRPRHPFRRQPGRPIVVPVLRVHRGTIDALSFARELSAEVTVVVVDIKPERTRETVATLRQLNWDLRVAVVPSPFRSVTRPLVAFVQEMDRASGELCVVVLAELTPTRWWHGLLHNATAEAIIRALRWADSTPGVNRCIVTVPYRLHA